MKKYFILFLFLFGNNIIGADLDLTWQQMHTEEWLKFVHRGTYSQSYDIKNMSLNTKFDFRETEIGHALESSVSSHWYVSDSYDFWGGITYRDDEVLNLKSRVDWKLGGGVYLLKEKKIFYERTIKLSYGLIFRDNRILHSFRIKDSAKILIVGYDAVLYQIIATDSRDQNETRLSLRPYVKVFKIKPGLSLEYVKTNTNSYLEMAASLGIKL